MKLNQFDDFLVVIPAYNEFNSISLVVKSLKKSGFKNILVVDDGSNDNTGRIAQKVGAKIIKHRVNIGMGGAVRSGFKYAVSHTQYKYVLTIDADGQHRIEDAKKVAMEIKNGGDMTYGQRNLNSPGVPKSRVLYNFIADIFVFLFTGKFVKDVLTGLRCIKVEKLKLLDLRTNGYAIESEIVIEALKHRFNIIPVPIEAIYSHYDLKKVKRLRFRGGLKLVKELLCRKSHFFLFF